MNNDPIQAHFLEANQQANIQASHQTVSQPAEQNFAGSHQF